MSITTTNTTDLTGLFKEVYGDEVVNLVPDTSIITKMVPFAPKEKQLGNKYHQPVIVYQEHGVTYAAPDSGAFDLNVPISMKTQDAVVVGYQMVLRSALSYEAAAKAASSKNAFKSATELQVENMLESLGKRLELQLLYGQTGLGNVNAISNYSGAGDLTVTVTFASGTWAAGIWAGSENSTIEFFNAASGAKIGAAPFVIVAVDTDNKALAITGAAGDITALNGVITGPGSADVYFAGSRTGASAFSEMAGLDKITTNAGSLFGIDASQYNLWKGNTFAAGASALTFAKLQSAVAKAQARGLSEDVDVLVNPATWANLNNDQAALRKYDSTYSTAKATNGSKVLEFYTQSGVMKIQSHIYVKEGEAFVLPFSRVKRIGAQDISFKTPGQGDQIFRQLDTQAGFEYRLYTNQAIVCETPARMVKVTGIVNA